MKGKNIYIVENSGWFGQGCAFTTFKKAEEAVKTTGASFSKKIRDTWFYVEPTNEEDVLIIKLVLQ